MGVLISDLFSNFEESSFKFGRYTVNIKYQSQQMTPAFLKNMVYIQSLERRQSELFRNPQLLTDALNAISSMIADMLVEWDLMQEENVMYPITKDELAKLDMRFLFATLSAIRGGGESSEGEEQPGETTNSASSATSSRQEKSDLVPSGIPTSSPRVVSIASRGSSSQDLRRSRKNGLKRRSSR